MLETTFAKIVNRSNQTPGGEILVNWRALRDIGLDALQVIGVQGRAVEAEWLEEHTVAPYSGQRLYLTDGGRDVVARINAEAEEQ
mgnify:CR=1 FL=1